MLSNNIIEIMICRVKRSLCNKTVARRGCEASVVGVQGEIISPCKTGLFQ